MYARVARFEGGQPDEIRAMGDEMRSRSEDGPPEGLPAVGLTLLIDPESGRRLVIALFATEADLHAGDAFLNEMEPPIPIPGHRVSVETYEVAVERRL